jgi:hypothetical protein
MNFLYFFFLLAQRLMNVEMYALGQNDILGNRVALRLPHSDWSRPFYLNAAKGLLIE